MILITFGTRPEYIKVKPLIDFLNKRGENYKTLFTGQHNDLLNNIKVDYSLKIIDGNNRLDSVLISAMNQSFWDDKDITHVLVQGDTTSVLSVSLAAFNRKIKIIHLEAGLRTYDNQNPYPEEQNRRLVSQIVDIHLCPTEISKQNLINEKILGDKFVIGNTVLDNLIYLKEECEYTNKILITLHRRENHYWLDKWFIELSKLAEKYNEYEFIIPLHPNPNVQKYKYLLKNISIIEPLPYDQMLNLLIKTRLVITDSGGLQEECSFFNKICLTCRKVTERPEAIGQSTFLVKDPFELKKVFKEHINNYRIDYKSPFGDGKSSEKIYKYLKVMNII